MSKCVNKDCGKNSVTCSCGYGDDYEEQAYEKSRLEALKSQTPIQKAITEIETLLNEFHNDMAKSVIDMDVYNPLSSSLLEIKEKVRKLINQPNI